MQICVLIGNVSAHGSSRLQQEQERLVQAGYDHPVINAGAYAGDGLLTILEVRVNAGQREILVDDCTRAQIQNVLAWQSSVEDDTQLDDLTVYLARRD